MALTTALTMLNRGRPSETARWMDTLRTINPAGGGVQAIIAAAYYGGPPPDTAGLSPENRNFWRTTQGDLAAGGDFVAFLRTRAAADSAHGFWYRMLPMGEAMVAVQRRDPAAPRLVDVADSLWRGYEANAEWASIHLARLYQSQGRIDRALRAVRRRWNSLGYPKPMGLAASYRLEGQLAGLAGDRVGAIRAYRNYLRMRVDPEPSMIPQRDSVRAELAAIGDSEGAR